MATTSHVRKVGESFYLKSIHANGFNFLAIA
jgi:hypothetical protein